MKIVKACDCQIISLGRIGENLYTHVAFDVSKWLEEYPDASITLLNQRPGDPAAYPVNPAYFVIENGVAVWTVQNSELAVEGEGRCELIAINSDTVMKSHIYQTKIFTALDGNGNPPEPWESWVEQVILAGEHAPTIRDGIWWAWDTANEEYVNTDVPATGATGNGIVSTVLNDDYTLTITYTNGDSVTVGPIRGAKGDSYVITQADYQAIAAEVAQDAQFDQKVQAAEDAANLSRNWADGKNLDGSANPQHSENNAEYFATQAGTAATTATGAKDAIQNMTVSATELQPGQTPTVTKTVDPDTGAVNLDYGIPPGTNGTNGSDGVTFTPAVSNDGTLSWTNDGQQQNPQSINIPALVRGIIDETVTGTTPSITGVDNHRYTCGEVSTISITPPSTGIIDVIFTSGSTAAVLTCTGVIFPVWFDPDSLDANTLYEINIAKSGNSYLGVVTTWPTA